MIDAAVPTIPSSDVDVAQRPPSTDSHFTKIDPVLFVQKWYQFFNDARNFMKAFRAAPKQVSQADIAKLGIKLAQGGVDKIGIQIWEPTFGHLLRWSGSAWEFSPSDNGSGYTVTFLAPPTIAGWVQCSGQTVSFLLSDGTLGTQVLPNTPGDYFRL